MSKTVIGYGARVRVTTEEAPHIGGAVLEIEQGKETDLMFHTHTNKIFYVLYGKLKTTIVADGQMKAIEVDKGSSFAVKPGLVYQMHGLEKSVVVEYSDLQGDTDTFVISKGTRSVERPPAPVMTAEDMEALKVEEATKKVTKKKSTRSRRKKKGG